MKERNMPRIIVKQLENAADYMEEGENIENAILDKASELGYEVEDEYSRPNRDEEGAYMHNVKLVKVDYDSMGNEVAYVGWCHFNHPAPQYAKRNSEWFWYVM